MSEVDQLSPALELLNNLDVAVTNAEKSFQEFRELPTGERITFFNELIAEFEKIKQ